MNLWKEVSPEEYDELTAAGALGIVGSKIEKLPAPTPSGPGMNWRRIPPWPIRVYLVQVSEE